MKGKDVKKQWPDWAKEKGIQDEDFLYLAGDKIKVLREGGLQQEIKPKYHKVRSN